MNSTTDGSERTPLLGVSPSNSPNRSMRNRTDRGSYASVNDALLDSPPIVAYNSMSDLQQARKKMDGSNTEHEMTKDFDVSEYSRPKQILLFVIMLLVNVLGPLSTEAQVPALQTIADDFNTTSQYVQLTITIYMLFFGISQLAFGTLSDTYGRRKTLIFGLVIYVLTNVGCALSPNIAALNVFRAFQAMGSGAGMVIVYAIARDVFSQDDRTRVLGILGGIRPIVIASSPVFGGAVTNFLGWRYIFWIIGALSAGLLVLVVLLLPETRAPGTRITTWQDYSETVKLCVRKRVFVGLVIISGAVYAGVFIMFNEFSFVFENRYGFGEMTTGFLCGAIVFGLMIGSVISIALVRFLDPIAVVLIGIIQLFICGCLLVLPFVILAKQYPGLEDMNFWWSLVPLFLYVMADGLMLPHLISTALEPFKQQAGTASALAGFWRFFSAAVIALIVSSSSSEHLLTLHVGTAAMALSAGAMYSFTLWGADASEFTKSRDAKLLHEQTVRLEQQRSGVTVVDDDDSDFTIQA